MASNHRQVGNSSTHATGYILCAKKTGSEFFYQFCPPAQGFLKIMDDQTGSVPDVCFEVLCQSMNDFCVVIDWSSIDRYQSIPIN